MLTNDMRLVKAAQKGDYKAFTSLVRKHSQTIYLMALKLIRDPEDAREVVQESFLKAYLYMSQFQGEARFSTWLGRIACNEALMRIRRRPPLEPVSLNQMVSPFDDIPLGSQIEDERPDPESAWRLAELRQVVHRAIRTLAPRYRKVVILRHIQDRSTRETAEILGLSVTAVKSRLRRARCELRRRLYIFHESGCRVSLPDSAWQSCKSRSFKSGSQAHSWERELAA
jgi:RNA polymerase sigma-70 factor, ECF subfamily